MQEIDRILTGALRENVYVVADAAGAALMVDPGDDCTRLRIYPGHGEPCEFGDAVVLMEERLA
jgi:hypothetical protein